VETILWGVSRWDFNGRGRRRYGLEGGLGGFMVGFGGFGREEVLGCSRRMKSASDFDKS